MSKKQSNPQRFWSGPTRSVAAVSLSAFLLAACGASPETMLASARGYLEKNDLNAASIQLKNALSEKADLVEARFLLGKVNIEQGNLPGAVKELQRARDLGYPPSQVQPLLARALLRSGETDRVLKEYAALTLDDPQAQAVLAAVVGDAHLLKGQVEEARAGYQRALSIDANEAHATLGLARISFMQRDAAGSERAVRALIERHPDMVEARTLLAETLLAQQRGDEALAELDEIVRLSPGSVAHHFMLVSLLLQQGRIDDAAGRLVAMKKAAPADPSTLYLQAFIDFRNNRLVEARDALAQSLKQAPEYLPAHLLAGSVLVRLNDHVQGQMHLGKVLARSPMQYLARTTLVASHLAAGEGPRALEAIKPLLELPKPDAKLLGLAGQVYMANGDFDKAESYFQRAAAASPDDAGARMRLGIAKMAGGDAQGAFADLEQAAGMDQVGMRADLALVAGYMRRGDFNRAQQALQQLERKQPDSPMVHNLWGGLMLSRKDLPAARAAFEKALTLKPDYLAAVLNLARMDIAEREVERGLGRLKALTERDPRNVEAHLAHADLLLTTRADPAVVLAALQRAEAAAPTALQPKLAIVQHHLRTRDLTKALTVAQQASVAHPNDVHAMETLARAQLASGDSQQAISSYNKLINLQPQAIGPLIQLAEVHRGQKDYSAAEQALRKALVIRPDAVEAQMRLAIVQVESGDRGAALHTARTLQKQRSDAAVGYMLEGDIQSMGGKWNEAAVAYQRALTKTRSSELAIKQHVVLGKAGRSAEADRLAADWLREQPKDVPMRGYLADRALAEQRYADAAQQFRVMNELVPNNPMVLNNLAWSAGQIKDPRAQDYAEQALALQPDNSLILDTVGMLQIEHGQAEKGLVNLMRAVTLAPDSPPLRMNLARSYARLGRSAEARKELDILMPRLKEGSPTHSEATALLKTL